MQLISLDREWKLRNEAPRPKPPLPPPLPPLPRCGRRCARPLKVAKLCFCSVLRGMQQMQSGAAGEFSGSHNTPLSFSAEEPGPLLVSRARADGQTDNRGERQTTRDHRVTARHLCGCFWLKTLTTGMMMRIVFACVLFATCVLCHNRQFR